MGKVITTTHVWVRDKSFEKDAVFDIVDEPKADTDVDPATAAGWKREGWAKDVAPDAPAEAPVTEGQPE